MFVGQSVSDHTKDDGVLVRGMIVKVRLSYCLDGVGKRRRDTETNREAQYMLGVVTRALMLNLPQKSSSFTV